MRTLRHYTPVILGTLTCWALVALLALLPLRQTFGTFMYPLDDTYIHLALAQTLAFHHVWGMGPLEFGSASSSPGWTVLLAAIDLVAGSHLLTALVLNLIAAALLLGSADCIARSLLPNVSYTKRTLVQLALVLWLPLPPLVLVGMEHTAHTLFILLTMYWAVQVLKVRTEERIPLRHELWLILSAFGAGSLRYESVFAIVPVAILLLLRRRFRIAIIFTIASATTPVFFGLYSHHLAGIWVPFSVIAKSFFDHPTIWWRLRRPPYKILPISLVIAWAWRAKRRSFWDPIQIFLFLVCGILLGQLMFGGVAPLLRYEGYYFAVYLVAMGVWVLDPSGPLQQLFRSRSQVTPRKVFGLLAAAAVSVLLLLTMLPRVWRGFRFTEQACVDRFFEHYQMARFAVQYYDHDTIVINDIGVVGFYSHAHMLDLAGLGSIEPVKAMRSGHLLNKAEAAQWSEREHASIAMVQHGWLIVETALPNSWKHVASICTPSDVVFHNYEIAFYAVDPQASAGLLDNLRSFKMPARDHLAVPPEACPDAPSADGF